MEHKNPENILNDKDDKDVINLSIPNVDDNSIKVLLFDVAENQREDHLVTDENQQDDEWEVLDNLVSLENINMNYSSFDNNQNTCTIGGRIEYIYIYISLKFQIFLYFFYYYIFDNIIYHEINIIYI